ncbi:XdhC family protein [Streptomyces sp. HB2AG]|uniref:XdhC family protein n=1 Tax=Streptomyces sp. HB2AG TaxID=2983400 RepID=UPI0022AA0FAB|nr:XdhC/CoxI family protein [Streptomyces sp. HB2AG]MCZ2525467.1 XdhC family protein [Streptomyces sp. HB2AG]
MLDIAAALADWCAQGRAFAVATVTAVSGSAPRRPGAALAVDRDGEAVGSVSGGCVEGAVYELCRRSLADGRTVRERFGHSGEDAFAAGLTCGGEIDVLVQPFLPGDPGAAVPARALAAAAAGETAALARVVDGPGAPPGAALLVRPGGPVTGTLGGERLDGAAAAAARALLDAGRTGTVTVGADGGRCGEPLTLLVECSVPPPRMLVFGAVDFAAAMVRAGRFLGHRVTVCDARPVFATAARFPEADEVVVQWPHRYLERTRTDSRTAVVVLTHDPKFDVPLLERALRMPLAYVGAMGSRRTHDQRLERLRAAGLTGTELARLHSPIGLDLGALTPEETALSVAAEIVARRRGGTGLPLSRTTGPLHHDPPPPVPESAPVPAPAPAPAPPSV